MVPTKPSIYLRRMDAPSQWPNPSGSIQDVADMEGLQVSVCWRVAGGSGPCKVADEGGGLLAPLAPNLDGKHHTAA